jgi:hypothetical protein
MSFTKVAPAGIGTEPGNSILIGDSLLHSTGIDIGNNTGIGVTIRKHGDATFTGIITASAFFGDGSGLEGVSSSGIGTPLSDDDTSDLNKIYYVNQELSIGSTITVNHPSSAVASYTHYQDLVVTDDADFIVSDGDTFIPDVLGIRTSTSTASAATGGRIRAGTITNAAANGAPNFPNGLTGTTGTFTGNLGVGGVLTYEDVTNIDSVGVITARLGINLVGNDLNVGSNIKIGNASGIVTATSFSGDGSALTGVGASFGNSSINTSGIITATSFVPTTGQLSHRNLIINGDMRIAQRSTSITQSSGYGSVDRIIFDYGGIAAHIPQAQVDVSSGTTPYTLGFRKAFKITNGNQGSSLPTAGYISIIYKTESQDIANSGWNYNSASSYITLSFWIKASVAQNYYFRFQTKDGTSYNYPMETGSLTANTWTKIIKTIPGNSNLQIDNNSGEGPKIEWATAWGTDSTSSSVNLNQWAAYSDGTKTPDQTTTWYTTNSATFEITGVQLEVGPVATPFEHKTEQEELLRCYRYYYKMGKLDYKGTHFSANEVYGIGMSDNDNLNIYCQIDFPVPMREPPSTLDYASVGNYRVRRDTTQTCTANPSLINGSEFSFRVNFPKSSHGWGTGQMLWCMSAGSGSYLGFSAEL